MSQSPGRFSSNMFTFTCSILFSLLLVVSGHDEEDSKAVKYSADSLNLGLATNNHFVMFYAPWCGHCSRLMPTWETLAAEYNDATTETEVIIGKVDCTVETNVCSEHDVTGYPTLKFFKTGHDQGTKYRGSRDVEALKSFIKEQLGKAQQEGAGAAETEPQVPSPVSALAELTDETFDNYIATGNHFVKFYAPWCGYCKRLEPVWDRLAQAVMFTTDVRVSRIDCTLYKDICHRYEVKGYPTLIWIENGEKVDKYSGDRSLEDMKSYVNQRLGAELVGASEKVFNRADAEPVVHLSTENFGNVIEKGFTFVKFFAPWCGHCKRMAPTWNELATKFLGNTDVQIGKVDCTVDLNKSLCREQEVSGYPTIFLYKDGVRVADYEGNRQLDDMFSFVTKHVKQHDEL